MTIYLGENLLAGSFKSGASWEVGDIGQAALGIDESLNKRRYLNGQVISQTQFAQFTAWVKQRVSIYPSLATSEANWQTAVTNSDLGQCGQFVIDDVNSTIRLPKVVNLQGLMDLTHLGETVEAGLPNITGEYGFGTDINTTSSGAAKMSLNTGSGRYISSGGTGFYEAGIDASGGNSIYGNSSTVQPESVQYPYFIQVAEGIENSVDVSREIELSNPFSLLDYKFSEYEITNASWLRSNGQYNSGTTYVDVYNLLLQIYNGTVAKAGVSVKLSTETYADTDFVLNTSDTTFRLPLKVALASGKAVSGIETSTNGLYLYFYVGAVVQDASVIAAASVLTQIAELLSCDYVVESKTPTAEDPTWYRVYKSGWVEQGGIKPSGVTTVSFPKEMVNVDYWYIVKGNYNNTSGSYASSHDYVTTRNTTSFILSTGGTTASWEAKGQGA